MEVTAEKKQNSEENNMVKQEPMDDSVGHPSCIAGTPEIMEQTDTSEMADSAKMERQDCRENGNTTQILANENITDSGPGNQSVTMISSEKMARMDKTKVGDMDDQECNGNAGSMKAVSIKQEPGSSLDNSINNLSSLPEPLVEVSIKQEPTSSLNNSISNLSSLSESLVEVMSSTDATIGGLVAYSTSDEESGSTKESGSGDSSSSSSESESSSSTSESDGEERPAVEGSRPKANMSVAAVSVPPPRSKRELMLQDLPEVPFVDFRLADNEEVALLGKISSIIGQLVVVASNRNMPALNEDTVLFKEDRHPIGVVFEIFGPVPNPFYTVRFNSTKEITDRGLVLGCDIYYAPKQEEITNYVFVKQLEAMRGSDASWANDEEPPLECLDYSDDEAEKKAKKEKMLEREKRKAARREGESSSSSDARTTRGARHQPNRRENVNHNPHGHNHQNDAHSQKKYNHHSPRQPFQNSGPVPPFRPRGPPPPDYRVPAPPFGHRGPPPFDPRGPASSPDQRGHRPWAFDPRGLAPQHFDHGPFGHRGPAPPPRHGGPYHPRHPSVGPPFNQQPWQPNPPPPYQFDQNAQFPPGVPPPPGGVPYPGHGPPPDSGYSGYPYQEYNGHQYDPSMY